MHLFVVKIGNLLPEKLHYTLRNYDMEYYSFSETLIYTVYLSPSGKLCSHLGAAYLDSQEVAQSFLDHYRHSLDKRGFGAYTAVVERVVAGKHELRWFGKTQPRVLAILGLS